VNNLAKLSWETCQCLLQLIQSDLALSVESPKLVEEFNAVD